MAIIGISGRIGSGKDTVGKIIQYLIAQKQQDTSEPFRNDSSRDYRGSGWEVKKFAGKLKQIVSLLTGIPVEDLERQDVKDRVLGKEWEWHLESKQYAYKLTVRGLLQRLGTDAMRDMVHPNIHVNALFSDYVPTPLIGLENHTWDPDPLPNWLITDMRFPNELEAVKQRGGITIRVQRLKYLTEPVFSDSRHVSTRMAVLDPEPLHPSETALDTAQFAYTIHNNGSIEDLIASVREVLRKAQII